MPGYGLAQKIKEVYNKNPNINCLILLNHGIFTFSDDAKESYDLMIKYVTDAEKALRKLKRKKVLNLWLKIKSQKHFLKQKKQKNLKNVS